MWLLEVRVEDQVGVQVCAGEFGDLTRVWLEMFGCCGVKA